ncbi:cytochrome c [Roseomonas sp. OT10]|uniref:cytochrome c n=1 Tax=Roseomonas cutis TaxID=2897332 RepID=UPI001E28827D|nr:cytochrome c [Roseomonas sp. OT10]UFN50089.1 cytochrome c [Roseomonas sp. OT10]
MADSFMTRWLRPLRRSLKAGAVLLWLGSAAAADGATLTVDDGSRHVAFGTEALLASPSAVDLLVQQDPAYGGAARRYRAVPVTEVLSGLAANGGGAVEAAATDGFVTQIPVRLLEQTAGSAARAWLAVEPPDAPWPAIAGRSASAGPFYIVWERPELSGIAREYWPFQLATLRYVPLPTERWPQLAVDPALPADHAARVGQAGFAANCLPCHRLNGAGASDMGPDLNRPMSPTEYFEPSALRRYLRDPGSVRDWPQRVMQGFSPEQLSDDDINGIVVYLDHMARRRAP